MSPSRYFIAAAIVLLLGAAALPTGLTAYESARHGSDPISIGLSIYGSFVIVIAFAGPIVLVGAAILSLLFRDDR